MGVVLLVILVMVASGVGSSTGATGSSAPGAGDGRFGMLLEVVVVEY